jgi:hypothetical protein
LLLLLLLLLLQLLVPLLLPFALCPAFPTSCSPHLTLTLTSEALTARPVALLTS